MMRLIAAVLAVLAVAAAAAVSPMARQVVWLVFFGWLSFLARTLPKITVNPAGVATAAALMVLLAASIQYLGRWWCKGTQGGAERPQRKWHVRWTVSVIVLLLVMFAVGYSAIGLARHVGWVISSTGPIFEEHVEGKWVPD